MLTIFKCLALLPLAWLQGCGALIGRIVYRLSPAQRARIARHLDLAWPSLAAVDAAQGHLQGGIPGRNLEQGRNQEQDHEPALDRDRIASASAAHSGRMLAESPWLWFRPADLVAARFECLNLAAIERAEAAGKGLMFLTPHIGSFDAAARWYSTRGRITVMYKPPKKSWLQPLMKAARSSGALQPAPASLAGLRQLVRALRRGEAVAILPDQVPTDGDGQWVPFFGEPAYTMTLPQRLAGMTGAAVLLVMCERLCDGHGWRLHVEQMHEEPTPAACNLAMQRLIARLPEQYLWSYNRYKRPAGVPEPGKRQAVSTAAGS